MLLLFLGTGLLVLNVLCFYGLQRMVIRPLQEIQRGTEAIAKGDLHHRLDVCTGDELESLASGFNRMVQQLEDSYGQLAEEQSRILAAIEASQDAIWVSDANQRLVMVNSAMERLTGKPRGTLVGQRCRDVLGLRSHEGEAVCDAACPLQGMVGDCGMVEGHILAAAEEETWVEISFGRVSDPDGGLAGTVHIVRDLTQRREVDKLKDEFISMVSHELRTPLNHIKGFATTLLQTDVEWDAASQRDFLGSIGREADRLADLVGDILHLSALEAAGLPMEKERYQVDDPVRSALQRRHQITASRRVDVLLSPELPQLFVDGREIGMVLMNLIENAVKYSHSGTPTTLRAERQSGDVVLSVADQGTGVPQADLERVFERFYRVNGAKRRAPGTGLGLAICKRIVEAHDGRIWVESTPQVGSCFYFSLPLYEGSGLPRPLEQL